jgi:hypothetical protein
MGSEIAVQDNICEHDCLWTWPKDTPYKVKTEFQVSTSVKVCTYVHVHTYTYIYAHMYVNGLTDLKQIQTLLHIRRIM